MRYWFEIREKVKSLPVAGGTDREAMKLELLKRAGFTNRNWEAVLDFLEDAVCYSTTEEVSVPIGNGFIFVTSFID